MKIGIYVGSFNPVHIGHIKIVEFLLENLLDKVIIIPTGNYWEKNNLIDIRDRINMLKFFENNKIIINDTLNDKNYTYEILNHLKKEYLNDELYLIIGADNIPKFHLWKNVDDILKNKVIVLNRDDVNINDYINKFDNSNNFIIMKDFEKIDVSSTNIRNDIEENKEYLDNRVYEYIKKNKLYEGETYEKF